MENDNLLIHITDVVAKIDLKIYEKNVNEETVFECHIHYLNGGEEFILTLKEEIAALLYEGFNQVFIEDNTEYQTNNNIKEDVNTLNTFFDILKQCDIKHFNS